MDSETARRRCHIISNAICAGTEDNSCFKFKYCRAFAVNVAAFVAERLRLFSDLQMECVPTITGSASEFYIEPMLSCVGDYDIMFTFSNEIAVPAGYPVPHLSSGGDSKSFEVFEIRDSGSRMANYVYLLRSAETTSVHQVDLNTLCVAQRVACLSNCVHSLLLQASGPAIVHPTAQLLNNHERFFESSVSSDFVRCIHCPIWPPQAARWPHRPRYNGWPDSATINRVVSQGCDVVPVAHPCHKDDTSQWRLSFSRAEVVLLNSWTTQQQIVYHMLRFFVKTERLKDKTRTGDHCDKLSMYHIKTLMLWACELHASAWWTQRNVIQLCRELLNMLGTCLYEARCDHYFLENCNLLHYLSTEDRQVKEATHQLISVTDIELAEWFLRRYLKKIVTYNCPDYVQLLQLLNETTTCAQLESALSVVVEWRTETFRVRSLGQLESAVSDLSTFLSGTITKRMCKIYDTERDTIGPLHDVFVAFVFLTCSGEIEAGRCLYNRMLHVLAAATGREFGAAGDMFEKYGEIGTESLERLMVCWHRCVLSAQSNISPGIFTELTKAFLRLALRRNDRHADESIGCLANGYLAILCYFSGHYQIAIDFCKSVIIKRSYQSIAARDQKILKVDAQLMNAFDVDIATVSGIVNLYKYVQRKLMPTIQQTRYCTIFHSAKTLARFVTIKCYEMDEVTAATNVRMYEAIQQYRRYIRETSDKLFLADILLFRLVMARCQQFRSRPVFRWSDHLGKSRRFDPVAGFDARELSEMLIQSAIKYLTAFREFEMRQFGSDCVACTTDFEALNAYRCRQYDRCLSLSQDIVADVFQMGSLPIVCIDSPQLVLMDDEIASIVGLMHLIGGSRSTMSKIATQVAIALYLEIQCLLKLDRPVSSLIKALLRAQIAYHRHDVGEKSLSHWILAFIYRKARLHLSTLANDNNISPESLRDGESMVTARILRQDGCLHLQIQTTTKVVSYAVEPLRLLM